MSVCQDCIVFFVVGFVYGKSLFVCGGGFVGVFGGAWFYSLDFGRLLLMLLDVLLDRVVVKDKLVIYWCKCDFIWTLKLFG